MGHFYKTYWDLKLCLEIIYFDMNALSYTPKCVRSCCGYSAVKEKHSAHAQ